MMNPANPTFLTTKKLFGQQPVALRQCVIARPSLPLRQEIQQLNKIAKT